MGNICVADDEDENNYKQLVYCYKCGDTFYHKYGYSARRSCSEHDYDENDFCKCCHLYKKDIGYSGCFHIKKTRFWGLCDC